MEPTNENPPASPAPSKPWWQSKTILGAGAIVVVEAYRQISAIDLGVENVTEVFVGLGIAAGGILAIVGRIRATHSIRK